MQSGTCDIPRFHDVKQSAQLHILLWCLLGQVEVLRSLDHVLRSLCRRKEGQCGRYCVFSRWWVNRDSM